MYRASVRDGENAGDCETMIFPWPMPGQFIRFCSRSSCPYFHKNCIFFVTKTNKYLGFVLAVKMSPALHFCCWSHCAKYGDAVRVYKDAMIETLEIVK